MGLYNSTPTTGVISTTNTTGLYSNNTNFTTGQVASSVYSVTGGTGVTVNPTTGNVVVSIGQPVGTANNVTFANVTATGSLSNNYFTLANSAGTNGQVLTTNGAGVTSWTTPAASSVTSVSGSGAGISVSPTTGAVIVTNTGVTSAIASTGIGVSAATGAITFSNTGVTSIVAGTNVSVSSATGAVTVNATNTTYNIDASTVSGGANLNLTGSDASTDSVKFASGSGITITRTDANTITINNTAAPGGVTSITGTANQIIASSSTGAITLSTPQSIGTTSNVTFANVTATGNLSNSYFTLPNATGTNGQILVSNGSTSPAWTTLSGIAVTSITGTANQIIASSSTGAVTLSTPQSIGTTSNVNFNNITAAGNLSNNYFTLPNATGTNGQILVSNGSTSPAWTTLATGVSSVTGSGHITASPTAGAVIIGSDATNNNAGSTIVARDAAGGFSSGSITIADDKVVYGSQGAYGPPNSTFDNVRFGLYGTQPSYAIGVESNNSWIAGQDGVKLYSAADNVQRLWASTAGVRINSAFYLPTTDGTANQIIKTDGSGTATWASLSSLGVTSITGTANQIIASASTGAVTLSTPQDIATTSSPTFNNLTTTGDIAVNGGDITTTATTFNLVNTTATTVNFAQAAATISAGATTGSFTIRNGSLVLSNSTGLNGNIQLSGRSITGTAALTTSTTSSNQNLMSLAFATYHNIKYQVNVTSGGNYHSADIAITTNGTTSYITVSNEMWTSTSLTDWNTDISGANVRLLVTPTNAVTTYKVYYTGLN
jgi:hypothetical protein